MSQCVVTTIGQLRGSQANLGGLVPWGVSVAAHGWLRQGLSLTELTASQGSQPGPKGASLKVQALTSLHWDVELQRTGVFVLWLCCVHLKDCWFQSLPAPPPHLIKADPASEISSVLFFTFFIHFTYAETASLWPVKRYFLRKYFQCPLVFYFSLLSSVFRKGLLLISSFSN